MTFKTVIGLEIHVQLKTQSKMFCGCDNNAEAAAPNTLTCPVCLGLPGTLPVANRQAIEWVIKTGIALNGKISEFSKFDRKHYFYPDLPKGYQISQYDLPFLVGGEVVLPPFKGELEGVKKTIHLTRIHLEEDAGKLIHSGADSLVDLNRAGTPLLEIVTEPEIDSPAQAKIFMQELRSILRYLDVSDADMEKGHLRCDANISIEVDGVMGIPAEIKNINSFRMVERALIYEEKRQIGEIEEDRKIAKETRGWDDAKGVTYSQRSKEFAQDYRYFPEPDLPPFKPFEFFDIDKIKAGIPELPAARRARYIKDWQISIQDAEILAVDKDMAYYFEMVAGTVEPKLAANWIINELKFDGLTAIAPERLIELLDMISSDKISGKIAKIILVKMIETGKTANQVMIDENLAQITDESAIKSAIDKIMAQNLEIVKNIQAGKTEAIGYLVGQVMKLTRGQANPKMVNKILTEKIK